MKKQASKRTRNYLILLVCLISVLMISSSFAMLASYSEIIEKESSSIALQHIETAANQMRTGVEAYKKYVQNLASALTAKEYATVNSFRTELSQLHDSGDYGRITSIRYLKDGQEYTIRKGSEEDSKFDFQTEPEAVRRLITQRTFTCAGVVVDPQINMTTVAYCIPLDRFDYADALVITYPVQNLISYSDKLNEGDYSNSVFTAVCSAEGEIVKLLYSEKEDITEHGNAYDDLRDELSEKTSVNELALAIDEGLSKTYSKMIGGENYVAAVAGISDEGHTSFSLIGYYRAADIYKSGYFVIRVVLGEFMIFFVLVLCSGLYIFISNRKHKKALMTLNDTNALIDCPTRSKFERVGGEILERNKVTAFAVVVMDINHYEYLVDHMGTESMIAILQNVKMVISRAMQLDETFAYLDNGRFAMLLHYREDEDLEKRIKSLTATVTHSNAQFKDSYALEQYGGIYQTERKLTDSIGKMIDLAIDALKATDLPYNFAQFRIYNETMYASAVMNEYVEVHMESALQNHDFKVFYQPKYNIKDDRVDGCEALVRWYNPEKDEYMQPGVFLPLFEANRFIMKLDHYVYEQVLLYIEDSVLNGLPLVPVSVNVSRITAIDVDFVPLYTKLKREHNIADNFITIEFTESFAYEDYDMLRDIVTELHKNGFKCSIDDFGSGFSSYNILKELPMDEIKLDRFFIKDGYSKDRDLIILSSIISLAKQLHMKVTQEGVEFGDQVDLLRKLGCEVIQGYHYSKPLALTDYVGFLSNKKTL